MTTTDHSASPVWHAIINDIVGGWAVSDDPRPMSQHGLGSDPAYVIADFMSEKDARHVARLLNEDDR